MFRPNNEVTQMSDQMQARLEQQRTQIKQGQGFIAALDQSGGSTPKALRAYGIEDDAYTGDEEMFDLIHQMRSRIVRAPAFNGDKIIGAILFEMTMDRAIVGTPTADYLWQNKRIVPFLKIDKGLADQSEGVQLMNPMPDLDDLLSHAVGKNIFGTKMRSVIHQANPGGIRAVVSQQFDIARRVMNAGLVPIIEPEVNITAPDKEEIEEILVSELHTHLDGLDDGDVMLKISIPTEPGLYSKIMEHPRMLRVVALSGGYSRSEANALLRDNHGLIASFSRALTEGLHVDQSEQEFNRALEDSIAEIYDASIA